MTLLKPQEPRGHLAVYLAVSPQVTVAGAALAGRGKVAGENRVGGETERKGLVAVDGVDGVDRVPDAVAVDVELLLVAAQRLGGVAEVVADAAGRRR